MKKQSKIASRAALRRKQSKSKNKRTQYEEIEPMTLEEAMRLWAAFADRCGYVMPRQRK
jgi:hypothetical protein